MKAPLHSSRKFWIRCAGLLAVLLAAAGMLSYISSLPRQKAQPPELPSEPGSSSACSLPESSEPASQTEVLPEPKLLPVRLRAAGDNLLHGSIDLQAAAGAGGDGYDFSAVYAPVAELMQSADLTLLNQETLIAPSYEPSADLHFHSSDALIDCMDKLLGVDVFQLANDHCLDLGEAGLLDSLSNWRQNHPGLLTTGVYRDLEDYADIRLRTVNDMTFSFIGLTEGTDGLSLPEGSEVVILLAEEEEMIRKRLAEARQISDFVIVNAHGGEEYENTPTERQRMLAQKLADWGADLIIGHHPHVLQPIEELEAEDGRVVPVAYSLGNFISAKDSEACMIGGVLDFVVEQEASDMPAKLTALSLIPVVTHYDDGFQNVRIYPLADYTEELAAAHGIRSCSPDFSLEYIYQMLEMVIDTKYFMANP